MSQSGENAKVAFAEEKKKKKSEELQPKGLDVII